MQCVSPPVELRRHLPQLSSGDGCQQGDLIRVCGHDTDSTQFGAYNMFSLYGYPLLRATQSTVSDCGQPGRLRKIP